VDPATGIDSDCFHEIRPPEFGEDEAHGVVKDGVRRWIVQLYSHENCMGSIRDLLSLIETYLLVAGVKDRMSSRELVMHLDDILERGRNDSGYLLAVPPPSPHLDPPSQGPLMEEGAQSRKRVLQRNASNEDLAEMAVKRPRLSTAGLGLDPARPIEESEEPDLMDLN
jgi:hypothetical protein